MAFDVLCTAPAIDHGELFVVLSQLGDHRLAIGNERIRSRNHPVGKDRHWAHLGSRFSAKAVIPSSPSSLVNNDSDSACSSAIE